MIPAHIRAIFYREVMVNRRDPNNPEEWKDLPKKDEQALSRWLAEDKRNRKRLAYYLYR